MVKRAWNYRFEIVINPKVVWLTRDQAAERIHKKISLILKKNIWEWDYFVAFMPSKKSTFMPSKE